MVHFQAILVFWGFTVTLMKGVQGPIMKCDQNTTTEKKNKNKYNLGQKNSRDVFLLEYEVFHHFWGEDLPHWDLVKLAMGVSQVQPGFFRLAKRKQRACLTQQEKGFLHQLWTANQIKFSPDTVCLYNLIDDFVSSKYTLHYPNKDLAKFVWSPRSRPQVPK